MQIRGYANTTPIQEGEERITDVDIESISCELEDA